MFSLSLAVYQRPADFHPKKMGIWCIHDCYWNCYLLDADTDMLHCACSWVIDCPDNYYYFFFLENRL